MDPMIDLVRERTSDLQRTADTIRRDREIRLSTATHPTPAPAEAWAPLAALAAAVPAADSCDGGACVPVDARHAA